VNDVVIVGGGVIGLATAWRSLGRGLRVTVADPSPASKASHVAAGMLTPVSELSYGEESLLRLGLASRDRYPSFVAELEELTGHDTGFRGDGTLKVALDPDDLAVIDDLRRYGNARRKY
jgi:glycine oxidase